MSVGYGAFSVIVGKTYYMIDKFIHIAIGNIGSVIALAVIPWCKDYILTVCMFVLLGIGCSISDAGIILHM